MPPIFRAVLGTGVLAALLVLSGCDLFSSDGERYAGIVTERGTGSPVEGIQVSFQRNGSFAGYSIVSETLTDSAGRFSLRSSSRYALFVNAPPCYFSEPCPFDRRYSGGVVTIGNGDPTQIRIELVGPGTPPGLP